MKITIVQGPFLPVPPILGGAMEKFFYAVGIALAQRGHTITHIGCTHPSLPLRDTLQGVHHLRIPSSPPTGNPFIDKLSDWRFAARVRHALPPADILITNTFFLPLLCRTPQAHGLLVPYVGRFPQGQLSLYSHAAALWVPSLAVFHAAQKQSPALADKLCIVPLSLPHFPLRITPRLSPTAPYHLLYTGRIHPEKGLHVLLTALSLLPTFLQSKIHLRMVGPHEKKHGGAGEGYLRQLHRLAEQTAARVTFAGPIFASNVLAAEYAHADLFVYPSLAERGETFGVSPLEALSHGTPVLVSALECFADFVNPRNGFVFNHRTPNPAQSLADALAQGLGKVDTWPALSAAARQTASHFTLEAVVDLMLKEFESMTSPASSHAQK